MNGLKSQQYRWMKGGAETAKKLLPQVWSSELRPIQKIHATTHLLGSSVFLFVFLLGIFSVPVLFAINPLDLDKSFLSIFLISLLSIAAVYYVANVQTAWDEKNKIKSIFKFVLIFPLFLALSMGLSFHNSLAVIQGYLGKQSAFIRTPKFNILNLKDSFRKQKYQQSSLPPITIIEGLLALYFFVGILSGIYLRDGSMMIFHMLLFLGYSIIFFYSVKHLNYR